MSETNNNGHDDNSVFKLDGSNTVSVDPGQMQMFEGSTPTMNEGVTQMDIAHNDTSADSAPIPNAAPTQHEEEAVSSGTKMKIMATLVIVGIAGYAAYWVQEPVQLKTDLLGSDTTTSSTVADSSTTSDTAMASSNTVADSTATDATTNGQSVNVDVSLFGFDPATLTIDKGNTVVWTNTSTEDQTIIGTAPDGESFASPVLTSGNTFSYKFDQDADFEYYSTYNPALKATIKVGLGTVIAADNTATTTSADNVITGLPTNTDAPVNSNPFDTTDVSTPVTTTPDSSLEAASIVPTNAITTTTTTTTAAAEMSGTTTTDQLHSAATGMTPTKLSKTGPAEDLYAVIALGIIWFNRKKLAKVFKK